MASEESYGYKITNEFDELPQDEPSLAEWTLTFAHGPEIAGLMIELTGKTDAPPMSYIFAYIEWVRNGQRELDAFLAEAAS